MTYLFRTALAVLAFALLPALFAADAEARELLKEANAKFNEQDYYSAAKQAEDAELMADSVELKARAVKLAASGYRQAGLFYREFENIEKLLNSYSSQCDFPAMVNREFEIGDIFYSGYRDPAYYALRWVPWFLDEDRSVEVYEKAIGHAPYASQAPEVKLRMAVRMLESGSGGIFAARPERGGKDIFVKSLEILRGIVRDYPDSPQARSAYLHLGLSLATLAESGDGDGAYNREAIQVLNEFKARYPDAPETDFVDKLLMKTRDIQAERLLKVAEFYSKNERPEAAGRYLSEVVRLYPDSTSADTAERLLTEMDKTYIPQPVRPALEPRIESYDAYPIPVSGGELLISPQQSGGKYLVPIRDLGLSPKQEAKQ